MRALPAKSRMAECTFRMQQHNLTTPALRQEQNRYSFGAHRVSRWMASTIVDDQSDAPIGPGIVESRFLIEIDAWDWPLHIGLSSESMPLEHRFQGGLSYVRSLELEGRIAAPKLHRGKTIRVSLSPVGPDIRFGSDGLGLVGRLHIHPPALKAWDCSATLWIPEAALPTSAICLGSVWRYLHIWLLEDTQDIAAFSFSSTFHKNLEDWVNEV